MANKIGIFREDILAAGGVETWLYTIAKRWGRTHDITIYYRNIADNQLRKLGRLVRLREYECEPIELDTAIFCYDMMGIGTVQAKRRIHIVHADYAYGYGPVITRAKSHLHEVDEIYAVSKRSAKSASKLFKKPVSVLYNPTVTGKPNKPIKLMSATRLTHEKGLHRMIKLNDALKRSGVDYVWDVYTPQYKDEAIEGLNFKKPTDNIERKIKHDYDFVVSLSDTESYGYTNVETLMYGGKLVVTDLPVNKELGINNENAIVVPLRKHFVNYDKIVKRIIAQAPYHPPESDYSTVLGEAVSVDYNPTIIKNTLDYDWLLPDGRWMLPGQEMIIEDHIVNPDEPFIKIVK